MFNIFSLKKKNQSNLLLIKFVLPENLHMSVTEQYKISSHQNTLSKMIFLFPGHQTHNLSDVKPMLCHLS